MIKARSIKWARQWHVWQQENAYKILVGKPEGKNLFNNLVVDGKATLKYGMSLYFNKNIVLRTKHLVVFIAVRGIYLLPKHRDNNGAILSFILSTEHVMFPSVEPSSTNHAQGHNSGDLTGNRAANLPRPLT